MENFSLNDAATLVGLVFGSIGLAIGVMNYLRDNPKITVELQWDMTPFNLPEFDPNELVGVIRITNTGRRPAYVSHVALKLPKGYEGTHLVISEGLQGQKLSEGDPPLTFPSRQNELHQYAKDWRKLRAQVSDSTGKVWYSPRTWISKKPSWANENGS